MVVRAAAALHQSWQRLAASPLELRLEATLQNGQCFNWYRQPGAEPVWVGMLGRRLLALRETESGCQYRCISEAPAPSAAASRSPSLEEELRDYFQLETPLAPLYESWTAADARMAACCKALPGMRVLRQDPVECLFSFICSSNNNIGRIGGMLQALRRQYGRPLPPPAAAEPPLFAHAVGEPTREFFTFPTVEALADASEAELRALGLGYRAAFILRTAQTLRDRGDGWLPGLRAVADHKVVRSSLCELHGVGPKVADCVALFCLDQAAMIPVDTHVWAIACRDYDPSLRGCASLTPAVYGRVGELFQRRYGAHAGWAHSVLFAAELPLFASRLPEGVRREMAQYKEEQKAAKAEAKAQKAAKPQKGVPSPKLPEAAEAATRRTGKRSCGGDEEEKKGSAAKTRSKAAPPLVVD